MHFIAKKIQGFYQDLKEVCTFSLVCLNFKNSVKSNFQCTIHTYHVDMSYGSEKSINTWTWTHKKNLNYPDIPELKNKNFSKYK